MSESLEHEIRDRCLALGFHRAGIAAAAELEPEHTRYRAFVAAGMHGEMAWLARNAAARARVDGPEILAGAKSVIVCALAYHRDGVQPDRGEPGAGFVARYARGRDYHDFFRNRLRALAAWLRERVPGSSARPMVDTAPVLERAWAQRAGVGFVGKNGCIIAPGLGSYVLLGEVVTDVALAPDVPMTSRCGECTRCLDACPTSAFADPYVLDARRCVSYLTIELRGAIPEPLRAGVGNRLFGCDVCQEVCPFNRTAPPDEDSTREFETDPRWAGVTLEGVARLDDAGFRALTRGTPVSRAGRSGLVRNALVVMGNSGNARHLPVLNDVAAHDDDEMVRETARWAAARCGARER